MIDHYPFLNLTNMNIRNKTFVLIPPLTCQYFLRNTDIGNFFNLGI